MNTKARFFIRILAVLLVIASVAMVAVRQNEMADLRAEQQTLLNDSQEADRLTLENAEADKLRTDNAEVTRLVQENKDLLKLRNQVRQLRKQVEEMARLRAENERLMSQPAAGPGQPRQPVVAGNSFPREALRESGMGKPVMTLQTFFTALNQGNVPRAMECLTPEAAAKLQAGDGQNGQELLKIMDGFTGFQIIDRNQPSAQEINLKVRLSGTGVDQMINFKQVGNEWKMAP